VSVAAAALFVAAQQTTRPCRCPAPDRRAGGTEDPDADKGILGRGARSRPFD